MKIAKELHDKAMFLYEEYLAAKYKPIEKDRMEILKQAFSLEREASLLLKDRLDLEPTRGILFASAATMGYQLKDYRESERMVALGLEGDPRADILDELRDLFDKVNFFRHLTTKGIELSGDEFRFALGSGDEIMKGFAKGDVVKPRIEGIEKLYKNTVLRLNNVAYQNGKLSKEDEDLTELYYSSPQAASYAIVFKIPRKTNQAVLPLMEPQMPYVDEMLQCLDLLNEDKIDELKEKIKDDDYFHSFLINAKKIAPDGKDVKQVGFTVYRDQVEKIHPFDKIQSEISTTPFQRKNVEEDVSQSKREKLIITGILQVSNSQKKSIVISEEIKKFNKKGKQVKSKFKNHKITFPNETLRELVTVYYEEEVSVEVFRYPDNSLEYIDLYLTH